MNGYGIDGKVQKFISTFLADRNQWITVGGKISGLISVTSGIPQCSILGPILFLLYINDVVDLFDNIFKVKLFADDLKLYTHVYTVSQKNCAKLFLSELHQIFTNFDDFWQKDGKEAKIMRDALIFHLT